MQSIHQNIKTPHSPLKGAATVSGLCCLLIGLFAILGWQFDIDVFKRFPSGNWSMNPLTALSFIASGALIAAFSVMGKTKASHKFTRGITLAIGGIALVRVTTFLGLDLPLDQVLYRDALAGNRMSLISAICFALIAVSFLWIDSSQKWQKRTSDVINAVILMVGLLTLTAFVLDTEIVYKSLADHPMSLNAGIAFFFLGMGLFSVSPSAGVASVFSSQGLGGKASRRLLPVVFILPLSLGALRVYGQRFGWYDFESGSALSSVIMTLVLGAIVWRCARYLGDIDQLVQKQSGLLESVLASINDGIVVADKHGNIVMSNPAAQKLFNISLYKKNNNLWRDRIQFEGAEFDPLARALKSRSLQNSEVIFDNNGQIRYLDLSGQPILSQDGSYFGGVAVIRDVTMFRLAAKSLQQSNEDLERVVADRVSELGKAKSQIEQLQKLDAVGRLAGGIAHDFNNMLGAIQLYCDVISRKMDQPKAIEDSLLKIQKAITRGATLTRQFLIFSKEKPGPKKSLNMNEIFTDHVKMLQRLIGENISIQLKLSPEIDNIKADPHQIELVIMNLVINARDAMPSGGAITIETRNELLTEEFASTHLSSKLGPHVVITVTDTGSGIEENVRSKIFEPFFTTKAFGTATGLGLSTVYGIVKSLEGTIWVYSEVGQGTVFKIYIPVSSERSGALSLVKSGYEQLGGTETVLVVEDDPQLRGIYQDLLQQNGYKVLLSENGKQALSLVKNGGPKIDLIVTDMVMPEMGGAELGETLISFRPEAKILFISGYSGDRVNTRLTELKNTRYLQKPFNTQTMLTKIRELLAA